MTVGIVGLGLIGGSMAKAYKESNEWEVLGFDRDETTLSFSMLAGVVDRPLTVDTLGECDLVLIALYPFATCEYIRENAKFISKNALVVDLCGTKKLVCEAGFAAAEEHGFTFVGRHYFICHYSLKRAILIIITKYYPREIFFYLKKRFIFAKCKFTKIFGIYNFEENTILYY